MKTFLRILVVFGIIDMVVAVVEAVAGNPVSAKIFLGFVCLVIGVGGLFLLKLFKKN